MEAESRGRIGLALLLSVGVVAVSTGAVIALQTDVPALTKSAWRCGVAALVVAALQGRGTLTALRAAPRPVLAMPVLAGAFLALHFATWIASLDHTSVATSLLLVNTIPVWVVLLAPLVNRERTGVAGLVGVALALGGGAWLALGGGDAGGGSALGAFLAVVGAWGATGYFLVGRRVGGRLPLGAYLVACYGTATLLLTAAALASGTPLAPPTLADAGWLLALGLVPQLVGHTASNAALRRLPALLVALPLLLEPVVGSLLAWAVLGQAPGPLALRAGALILAGVALAAAGSRPGPPAPPDISP